MSDDRTSVAELENARHTFIVPSGMAAMSDVDAERRSRSSAPDLSAEGEARVVVTIAYRIGGGTQGGVRHAGESHNA